MFRKLILVPALAAVALAGSAAGASANQTVCLYNESPFPVTLDVTGDRYRDSRGIVRAHKFAGLVPPQSAGCCPPSHPACRARQPYVRLYWNKDKHARIQDRVKVRRIRLKLRWLKSLRNVRVIAPINPQIGPNLLTFCTTGFRVTQNARIRLHTEQKGRWVSSQCEIFTGRTNLRVVGHRNMARRTHQFVCNDTNLPYIFVVHGYYAMNPRGWKTTGFWKVARGRCRQLWLPSAYYRGDTYLYANSGRTVWAGRDAHLCINPSQAFQKPYADKGCPAGMKKVGFMKRRIGPGANVVRFTGGR